MTYLSSNNKKPKGSSKGEILIKILVYCKADLKHDFFDKISIKLKSVNIKILLISFLVLRTIHLSV